MELELKIAIVGMIGTLIGTVVGWLLSNISKSGKLNIFILCWKDKFEYNNLGVMSPSSSIEQTSYYAYTLELDIYNSSGKTKILRDLNILFKSGEQIIVKSVPHDYATAVRSQWGTSYRDIEPINIPPKTVLKYKLGNGFHKEQENDDLFFIWGITSVILSYVDEKGKDKMIPIKSEVYKTYFDRHK